MEQRILDHLHRRDYVPADAAGLLKALRLQQAQRREFNAVLRTLERSGQITRIKGRRYVLPFDADLVAGRIQITRNGRGFLAPDDPGIGEIAIRAAETGTALHDDHVLVRLDVRPVGPRKRNDAPPTGSVIRVIERRRTRFVGTLRKEGRLLYVVPDDPRFPHDIAVPAPRDLGRKARAGDKVVVELLEWESRQHFPKGELTEVLGPPTAEGVDMLAVLRNYDLPLKFPRRVLQEVRRIGATVTGRDMAGRTDCREHDVVTIDPVDAMDFDDAFHLRRAKGNRWRLWVHIADVSHYVKPGSALDLEARKRGNSTYLVDRVIPMLPEALSNELCSLKPGVDRLTKCVEFLIENSGEVVSAKFYPAVIRSKRRFSYHDALKVIRGTAQDGIESMLHQANRLAQRLRKRRFRHGSLDLEFPETRIRLDGQGKVEAIERVDYDESHQLIEELMLLANEAVAGRLMALKRPTIYRIHEAPNELRLKDYREEVLSHNVPCGNLTNPNEVRRLLRRLSTLAIGPPLKIGFLKSLMRARYAVTPVGHYGLAKEKYAHFTSPIRRYADLIVHRSLFEGNGDGPTPLRLTADHVSTTERNSADAERDSKQVKLSAHLEEQLAAGAPRPYAALVTDLRNFGFFVDVPDLGMSGLVPLSLLDDDFYDFDPVRNRINGRRSRRVIRLGDRVEVKVAKVDTPARRVDFRLAETPGTRGRGKSMSRKRSGKKKSAFKKPPRASRPPNKTHSRTTAKENTGRRTRKFRAR